MNIYNFIILIGIIMTIAGILAYYLAPLELKCMEDKSKKCKCCGK